MSEVVEFARILRRTWEETSCLDLGEIIDAAIAEFESRGRSQVRDADERMGTHAGETPAPSSTCSWDDCDQEALYCEGHAHELVMGEIDREAAARRVADKLFIMGATDGNSERCLRIVDAVLDTSRGREVCEHGVERRPGVTCGACSHPASSLEEARKRWVESGVNRSIWADPKPTAEQWSLRALHGDAYISFLEQEIGVDRAVCVCGCGPGDHEIYEEGESCGHDDHECIRTCPAIRTMVIGLRAEVERLKGVSDARRRALLTASEERAAEWRRAEAAEATLAKLREPMTEFEYEKIAKIHGFGINWHEAVRRELWTMRGVKP